MAFRNINGIEGKYGNFKYGAKIVHYPMATMPVATAIVSTVLAIEHEICRVSTLIGRFSRTFKCPYQRTSQQVKYGD